jgi:membrane protein required for colicin V production
LSKIDIVIAIIFLVGGYFGYKRGFLLGLFFLSAIVLGVFLAFKLMALGVEFLHRYFNADLHYLPYISFLIIFIGVIIVVMFIGNRFKNSMDKTFLGKLDALAGALLGVGKYAFCLSVLFWILSSLSIRFPTNWTEHSFLYPQTVKFAKQVNSSVGKLVPFVKGIFKEF